MTPHDQDTLDRLKSTYPGCVGVYTEEGLVVVRKPSANEAMELEDAVGALTDLGAKPNPYAGLEELKRLVVHPQPERTEEILQGFAESFGQILGFARTAAWGGDRPILIEADLREEELYDLAAKPDGNGRRPKRAGGRIFAVEHLKLEERTVEEHREWEAMTQAERQSCPDANPHTPRRVVLGRYLMRRLGLVEHRDLQRQIASGGFLVRTRNGDERVPRASMLAKVAREHAIQAPGCVIPDWERHPYLLILLGQAVRDQSALRAGSAEGKSSPDSKRDVETR